MSKPKEPRAGERLTGQEAQAYVEYLYSTLYKYAHEKIHKGTFMMQLREGKLPMPAMRQFFKNWGHFSLEVNTLICRFSSATSTFWGPSAPRSPTN